jgi:hypothetical protein
MLQDAGLGSSADTHEEIVCKCILIILQNKFHLTCCTAWYIASAGWLLPGLTRQLMPGLSIFPPLNWSLLSSLRAFCFCRLAAARFEDAAAARLTLLEGKVKFLENQLNTNKQQQQQPHGPAAAAAAAAAAGNSVLDAGSSSRGRSSAEATRAGGLPQQQFATTR